jgi:predicted nuclease of predicted toxin-antitoxin system
VRLLFDNNLSPRLVERMGDLFPEACHVAALGLDRATDVDVWRFAETHGYAIVTKDSDFNDLSTLHGCPPKLIWLRIGNATTTQIETLLRKHASAVAEFLSDPEGGTLALL